MNNTNKVILYVLVFVVLALGVTNFFQNKTIDGMQAMIGEMQGREYGHQPVNAEQFSKVQEMLAEISAEVYAMPEGRWWNPEIFEIDSRLDVMEHDLGGDYGVDRSISNLYGMTRALEADICDIYGVVPELADHETWTMCFRRMMERDREYYLAKNPYIEHLMVPIDQTETFLELLVNMEGMELRLQDVEKDHSQLFEKTWSLWSEIYRFNKDSEFDNDYDSTVFLIDDWEDALNQSRLDYAIDNSNDVLSYILDTQRAICMSWDGDYVFPFCAQ